uniref:glutaminase n=1 Tax=Periophthalmus magnuspinnatus TaxID=409849 RepID=A0A3B3Z713_9GOBI
MAASLANGGLCPLSCDQVLSPAATRSLLSVMQTAGLKHHSTAFHFKVHMVPAASSSHGALLAVVPGVLGLMAFSPETDLCGNPWRALHFCQTWSRPGADMVYICTLLLPLQLLAQLSHLIQLFHNKTSM